MATQSKDTTISGLQLEKQGPRDQGTKKAELAELAELAGLAEPTELAGRR